MSSNVYAQENEINQNSIKGLKTNLEGEQIKLTVVAQSVIPR